MLAESVLTSNPILIFGISPGLKASEGVACTGGLDGSGRPEGADVSGRPEDVGGSGLPAHPSITRSTTKAGNAENRVHQAGCL